MNSQLEAFLEYQVKQGRHLARVVYDETKDEDTIMLIEAEELTELIATFSIEEELRNERDWYGYNQALMLEFFAEWSELHDYDFVRKIENGWQIVSGTIELYADLWIDAYKKHKWADRIRYVPMHRTHINSLTEHAYACMTQDVGSVYRIQEHLGRYDIDATMFLTETGDYTEIYVSFREGTASFDVNKRWFKVVEK